MMLKAEDFRDPLLRKIYVFVCVRGYENQLLPTPSFSE